MIKEIDCNNEANPFSHRIEYVINEETCGYLEYSIMYDRMEIDNIYVMEEYRMMGIASRMMEYVIEIYKKNNLDNITLEVRVSNDKAINLYKKYGFRQVSIRQYYYGDEDGILMEKR